MPVFVVHGPVMSLTYTCSTCRLRIAAQIGARLTSQRPRYLSADGRRRHELQGDQFDQKGRSLPRDCSPRSRREASFDGLSPSTRNLEGQLRGRYSRRLLDPQQLLTDLGNSPTNHRPKAAPKDVSRTRRHQSPTFEKPKVLPRRLPAHNGAAVLNEESTPVREHPHLEHERLAQDGVVADTQLESGNTEEASVIKARITDPERFAEIAIKRLGRASETRDLSAAQRVWQDAQNYMIDNKDDRLPMSLYEHLLLTFLPLRATKLATEVWNAMLKAGLQPRSKTYTVMMRGSQIVNNIEALEGFWSKMRSSGIQPDVHAWSTRIFGLLRSRSHIDFGLKALGKMGREWTAAAKAAHTRQNPAKARKCKAVEVTLAELMTTYPGDVDDVPRPNQIIMNSAVSALASSNDTHIPTVLSWGRFFGIEPDLTSYNVLINVSMRHGMPDDVINILGRMEAQGIEANHTTWIIMLNSMFHGGMLNDLDPEEQGKRIIAFLTSISSIDEKGYALIIDRLLKNYNNPTAAQAVLEHMTSKGVRPSPHIYTILMGSYFQQNPPNLAAVKSLWRHIESSNSGYGTVVDSQFYDRMIEGYASHHAIVGTAPMLQFLTSMETEGKKPSWHALLSIARALWECNQLERLGQMVHRVRSRMSEAEVGDTGRRGQQYFWEFVIKTGILKDEGITMAEQVMERHRYGREHVRT